MHNYNDIVRWPAFLLKFQCCYKTYGCTFLLYVIIANGARFVTSVCIEEKEILPERIFPFRCWFQLKRGIRKMKICFP